jgi:hypothetical protein
MLCKIWNFHSGDYEECRLLGFKNPVRTSQETHYVSATESSQLMLCKIWCFHGGNYEECRLLGYKNPSSYFTGDTLRLRYRAEPVNAMQDLRFSLQWLWRMASSGMLRRVALLRTEVSEERSACIIRVTRIDKLSQTTRGGPPAWGLDLRLNDSYEAWN